MTNHFRHLGTLVSMGSREARVFNYAKHMMYEIWNNDGPMRIYYCKTTNSVLDSSKVPALLADYEVPSNTCNSGGCRISPLK
jgi:hypothetical protein